jgi:hypothetical protein
MSCLLMSSFLFFSSPSRLDVSLSGRVNSAANGSPWIKIHSEHAIFTMQAPPFNFGMSDDVGDLIWNPAGEQRDTAFFLLCFIMSFPPYLASPSNLFVR